jgi:hypothetical protein
MLLGLYAVASVSSLCPHQMGRDGDAGKAGGRRLTNRV